MKNTRLKLFIIFILLIASTAVTTAYWASSVTTNPNTRTGQVGIDVFPTGLDNQTFNQHISAGTVQTVLNGNYTLVEDVIIPGTLTAPIGTVNGNFDGGGHSIQYTMNHNGEAGLFNQVSSGATVKNLTITNSSITSSGSGDKIIGFITPTNNGTIENVNVVNTNQASPNLTANITDGGKMRVGGVVGNNYGIVRNATVDSHIKVTINHSSGGAEIDSGGVVAFNTTTGIIENSTSSGTYDATINGTVSDSSSYALGGVVGLNELGGRIGAGNSSSMNIIATVTNSNNSGTGGSQVNVGGFIGVMRGTASNGLKGAVATGNVTVTVTKTSNASGSSAAQHSSSAGGLVGHLTGATIEESYATGNVTVRMDGRNNVNNQSTIGGTGGLVGYSGSGTIRNSYATGNVFSYVRSRGDAANGWARAGGLIGTSNSTITTSYATGFVETELQSNNSYSYIGGLVGFHSSGSISNVFTSSSPLKSNGNTSRQFMYSSIGNNSGTSATLYYSSAQTYNRNGITTPNASQGTSLTLANFQNNLNNLGASLGWSTSIWTFTSGVYPILK